MAFNLPKVLKALLFSSSQPLSIKDIQALFGKFHDDALQLGLQETETEPGTTEVVAPAPALGSEASAPEPASTPEPSLFPPGEVPPPMSHEEAELYSEVPSLVTGAQIREAMETIAAELKASNDIFFLIEGPNGYRLVTHPRFARWIRILRNEPPPVKLTQSAIETLAIVAYRQPVTRTEIEAIRGVSADAGLNKLIERELVYITGRADLPGRPLQYGTTDKFLDFVGVKSLIELPSSDVLSPRQIDEWLRNAVNAKPPTDAEMGLPLEEGEGSSPSLEPVALETEPAAETGSDVAGQLAAEVAPQSEAQTLSPTEPEVSEESKG